MTAAPQAGNAGDISHLNEDKEKAAGLKILPKQF
jgi:hypothetical protein